MLRSLVPPFTRGRVSPTRRSTVLPIPFSAYAQAVRADGPVGYWRLGDAGGRAADSSGYARDGFYVGGVTLAQTGAISDGDTAALFNGTTGYVDVGNVTALNFTSAFSAEVWVKSTAGAVNAILVAKTNWATGAGWALGITAGKVIAWAFTAAGAVVFNTTTALTYTNGAYRHVVATWDGTTAANGVTIYVDGAVVKQDTAVAGTPGNTTEAVQIGTALNVPTLFNGTLDEVAVYASALTPARIAAHYALRTATNPETPHTPSPADAATSQYTRLSWVASGQTTADIYLGTSSPPTTLVVPKFVGFAYVPTLLPDTTYYWQIVAWNAGGSATGPIWSFTTPAATAVIVLLAGVDVTARVRWGSCAIHDALHAAPNTASLTFDTTAPVEGEALKIGLGTLDDADLLFAGTLQDVGQQYVDHPDSPLWPVSLVDYTFALNKRRPFGTWVDVSVTTIALEVAARYAPGFSTAGIQANLATASIVFDGAADFMTCWSRLATAINGIADVSYSKVLKLGLTDDADPPDPLDAAHPPLNDPTPIAFSTDLSQIRTRVYGKGHGETTLFDLPVGAPTIPIADAVMFSATGGQAIASTTAGGAQSEILTYRGVGYGYTPNFSEWTRQVGGTSNQSWTGLVWAEALGLFVAVSAIASLSAVMTSPDGVVWTTRTPAIASGWEAVAWSPTLALLVAVSANGLVMTSPDGITWTQRVAAEDSAWQDVIWVPELGLFIAVATVVGTGTHQVMTSPDGIAWTARTAASTAQWFRLAWSPAAAVLVAVALTGAPNAVMSSPDGITWTIRTATGQTGFEVAWSTIAGLFVITAGTQTSTSPDGITWTAHAGALPGSNNYKALIWSDAGAFIALGDGAADNIAWSIDGLTWETLDGPIALTAAGRWRLAWSPTLARLVAVGFTSALVPKIMTNTATRFDTLTGLNANNGLRLAMAQGSTVAIWVERNDLAAQTALGLLELDADGNPTDGIHEYLITNASRGEASLIEECDADLAIFSRPIVSATWDTRDVQVTSGKTVAIDLTTYVAAILADAPLAYWRLDEPSGTTFADETGHGHTVTRGSAVGLTYGVAGALADGSTGLALAGTQAPATFTGIAIGGAAACSVELWFTPTSNVTAYQVLLTQNGLDGIYFLGPSRKVSCYVSGDHVNTTALTIGTRYHVVVSIAAGGAGTFYINGVADGTFAAAFSAPLDRLFSDSVTEQLSASLLDEIAIYDTALTATQVARHYALRTALSSSATVFGLVGDFVIQRVDLTFDGPALLPRRHVTASSVDFTLMDLLRKVAIAP